MMDQKEAQPQPPVAPKKQKICLKPKPKPKEDQVKIIMDESAATEDQEKK